MLSFQPHFTSEKTTYFLYFKRQVLNKFNCRYIHVDCKYITTCNDIYIYKSYCKILNVYTYLSIMLFVMALLLYGQYGLPMMMVRFSLTDHVCCDEPTGRLAERASYDIPNLCITCMIN